MCQILKVLLETENILSWLNQGEIHSPNFCILMPIFATATHQHAVSLSVHSATSMCIVLLTLPCQSPKFLCRFLDLISVARGRNSV